MNISTPEQAANTIETGNTVAVTFADTYQMRKLLRQRGIIDAENCATQWLHYYVYHAPVSNDQSGFWTYNVQPYGERSPRMTNVPSPLR